MESRLIEDDHLLFINHWFSMHFSPFHYEKRPNGQYRNYCQIIDFPSVQVQNAVERIENSLQMVMFFYLITTGPRYIFFFPRQWKENKIS